MKNEIKDCIDYNPVTGSVTWKHRPRSHFVSETAWKSWTARFADKPAGTEQNPGKRQIHFQKRGYELPRVLYEMHYGCTLDHNDVITYLDGDTRNLKIDNLLRTTRSARSREICHQVNPNANRWPSERTHA